MFGATAGVLVTLATWAVLAHIIPRAIVRSLTSSPHLLILVACTCFTALPALVSASVFRVLTGGWAGSWKVGALTAAGLLVLIVAWQLGIFNTPSSEYHTFGSGFVNLKVRLSQTVMHVDGRLESVMANGAGATIELNEDGSYAVDVLSKTNCTRPLKLNQTTVKAGGDFAFTVEGCPAGKLGEVYSLGVQIPYSITVGGIATPYIESGTIRGPYE